MDICLNYLLYTFLLIRNCFSNSFSPGFPFRIFRSNNNLKTYKSQTCTALNGRVEFTGNYEANECKIDLRNVGAADAGKKIANKNACNDFLPNGQRVNI